MGLEIKSSVIISSMTSLRENGLSDVWSDVWSDHWPESTLTSKPEEARFKQWEARRETKEAQGSPA